MHLEVYAANLRQGGAVVTAAALIDGIIELVSRRNPQWLHRLDLIVSPQVRSNMTNAALIPTLCNLQLAVREDTPKNVVLRGSSNEPDVRYVVFGPEYLRSRARVTVTGFADGTLIQGWIGDPGAAGIAQSRDSHARIRQAIKKRYLGRYDAYIVQTNGMARALSREYGSKEIAVLPNLLSAPFPRLEHREIHALPPKQDSELRLFYPAKAYPHKNHGFLADVLRAHQEPANSTLTFVVTLTAVEYLRTFPNGAANIINVGVVTAAELPSLYEQTDGLFFPSLNETFSSSPLEAAFMRRPIVISDRPFAQDILSEKASYFDPLNAEDAAQKIHDLRLQLGEQSRKFKKQLDLAQNWANEFADAHKVASKYLDFLFLVNQRTLD
jgi:hypothetical protein